MRIARKVDRYRDRGVQSRTAEVGPVGQSATVGSELGDEAGSRTKF